MLQVLCIITTEAIATMAKREAITVVFGAQRMKKKKNVADTTIRSVVDALLLIEKNSFFLLVLVIVEGSYKSIFV